MNKAYIRLENELRDEVMLRKLHKRSEKYKHLNDNEVCILMLAMVRKICRVDSGKSAGLILVDENIGDSEDAGDGAGGCRGSPLI